MRFPPLFVLRPMVAVVLGSVLSPFCAAQSPAEKPALILQKWSGALNVPDPVAVGVDPQGRVYVAATTRRSGFWRWASCAWARRATRCR